MEVLFKSEKMSIFEFEKLIDLYGESIMQLAYTYVKDRQIAADIVQYVSIKAYEKNE